MNELTKEQLDIGEAALLASFSSSQVGKAEFIKKVFALARQELQLRERKERCPRCGSEEMTLAKKHILTLTAELDSLKDKEKLEQDTKKHFRDVAELRESAKINEKDKERLDWLDSQSATIEPSGLQLVYNVAFIYGEVTDDGSEDLRTAIDSAMRKEKNG